VFTRTDLRNIHVLWSFPFYITFLPRVAMSWGIVIGMSINTWVMSIGVKEFSTFSGWRMDWIKFIL